MNRCVDYRPAIALLLASGAAFGQCEPTWDGEIGSPGVGDGYLGAFATWDDGSGEAIYAGGSFDVIGGTRKRLVAEYDPIAGEWKAMRSGLDRGSTNGFVTSITGFMTPTGEKLIVGGFWNNADRVPDTRSIAAWDGSAWSSLEPQWEGVGGVVSVWALATGDIGAGERLFVGGSFPTAGAVSAGGIAAWDGTAWEQLGDGIGIGGSFSPNVFDIEVFDDGSGPAVFIGGRFDFVDGVPATYVAKWDGVEWSEVGDGLISLSPLFGVEAMTVFDDGTGPALYVAGADFAPVGEPSASVARWDGAEWKTIGADLGGRITSLQVFDDGSGAGEQLYLGGTATPGVNYLAKLVGGEWEVAWGGITGGAIPPSSFPSVFALGRYHNALLVGGNFTAVGDPAASANGAAMLVSCAEDCYADCDGDGELTFFDFLCFQNAFAAAAPYADCDGSGSLDFFDFLCFQNLFDAGCP
ncbi:MAG: hypothetical protein ACF8R7_03805 [Phycisphaerales bacterium JB039]